MTDLSSFYNTISKAYTDSNKEILSKVQAVFIQQLQAHDVISDAETVLDLAAGDGEVLKLLQSQYGNLMLAGIDISEEMLSLAKKKLAFTALCGSLEDAESLVKGDKFDLAIAHFVISYVGAETLLRQAAKTNRQQGYLHISTTTLEAFPALQEKLKAAKTSLNPFVRLCYYAYQRGLKRINLPCNSTQLIQQARAIGYVLVDHQTISLPLRFNSSTELANFFAFGGWAGTIFFNLIPLMLQIKFWRKVLRWAVEYPVKDQLAIESLLFKYVGPKSDSVSKAAVDDVT